MNNEIIILIIEAIAVYFLVLGAHSLRRKFGLAHFYALIGGITAVMSWITDAGVTVEVFGISFMIGSTVFYTSLLLGVFVVYVFDGPKATRIAISTIIGVSIMVPLIATTLHLQVQISNVAPISYIPIPSLRINTASVLATMMDLIFLAIAWEYLGRPQFRMRLWFRSFITLLGVMWLDVILFTTGAFAGNTDYFSIMQGTLISRLMITIFASPVLYIYIRWQNSKPGVELESRPVLAILQQVAEIKHELGLAQEEILKRQRAEERLEESNNVKELLIDIITHDLKNPVGVIREMSKLALEEHRQDEKIEVIKNSSDRLLTVMDNAIVMAQATLGDKVDTTPIDLAEIIRSLSHDYNSQLKRTNLVLEINLPDKLVVQANPIISEVFKNYISNAIKYASGSKRIIVDSEEKNDCLTINVRDNGTIIPERLHQKIFTRSYQIGTQKLGRGLGLSIVKRIAEVHQAEVGIKANHPHGNIFYFKMQKTV